MHNVVKWPNILQKSYGVHAARFFKYVWPFYNIMQERVKLKYYFFFEPLENFELLTLYVIPPSVL